MIDVFFPFWPPSVNHGWRHVGNRTLLAAPARDFRREMEKSILALRQDKKLPLETILGEVSASIVLHAPDRRSRDIDNYCKAIFDSLTHVRMWKDDRQVKELLIRWGEVMKGGGFRIVIKPFVDRV